MTLSHDYPLLIMFRQSSVVRRHAATTFAAICFAIPFAGIAHAQVAPRTDSAHVANPSEVRRELQQAMFNLFSAEELYFSEHSSYSASLDSVLGHWRAKIPVSVTIKIVVATPDGWQATAADSRWLEGSCAVFLGDLGSAAFAETKKGQKLKATDDGQPVCDWPDQSKPPKND